MTINMRSNVKHTYLSNINFSFEQKNQIRNFCCCLKNKHLNVNFLFLNMIFFFNFINHSHI